MDNAIEVIKAIGYLIIYPVGIAWISIQIARFHFEKDIKKQYLVAKDKVAIDIVNSLSGMLLNMWELVNINTWVAAGTMRAEDPNTIQRRQAALDNFHNFIRQSYTQLGQMGLYYGTEIVEPIAQLHSELNEMVNNNDFRLFENWDSFRRQRLLPILERLHIELRETVFDRVKSFHLYS